MKQAPGQFDLEPETVEKDQKVFFDKELHDGWGSISYEIVTPPAMRSVLSEAHVPGKERFSFDSAACGRRNSARLPHWEVF